MFIFLHYFYSYIFLFIYLLMSSLFPYTNTQDLADKVCTCAHLLCTGICISTHIYICFAHIIT